MWKVLVLMQVYVQEFTNGSVFGRCTKSAFLRIFAEQISLFLRLLCPDPKKEQVDELKYGQ